jgi:hypothetical protein
VPWARFDWHRYCRLCSTWFQASLFGWGPAKGRAVSLYPVLLSSKLIFHLTSYVNIDYLFFCALQGSKIKSLVISYDIACQWSKNIWKRMEEIPECLRFDPATRTITFLVPKFHLPAHILACHIAYSFNLTPNVGRTDGEGVERGWASLNPLANSTKEMGPGSRRDTIDDHFSDSNWKKFVGLGTSHLYVIFIVCSDVSYHILGRSLMRKVVEAGECVGDFVLAHQAFEEALRPEDVAKWTNEMEAWEADQTKPNPFKLEVSSKSMIPHLGEVVLTQGILALSLQAVRKQLNEAEEKDILQGNNVMIHPEVSPHVLIFNGLELESQQ